MNGPDEVSNGYPGRRLAGEDEPLEPLELRSIRESIGLTGERLAAVFGVRSDTLRRWESGRRPIPPRVRAELDAVVQATETAWRTEAVAVWASVANGVATTDVVVWDDDESFAAANPFYASFGARWWRVIAGRVAAETGARIVAAI
jgi:transcriptional regulator with XRE-family HTH domain